MEDNKILRWVKSGCPPIDLNENVSHVFQLANQVKQLQEDNERLNRELNVMDEFKKWLELQDVKKINKDASSTTFKRFIETLLQNHYSTISLVINQFEKAKEATKPNN